MYIKKKVLKIRKEMESNASSYNHFLKDQVKEMSLLTLLRNAHPLDRTRFAKRLHNEGVKDKELGELVPSKW